MKIEWQGKQWEWNEFDQKLLQVNDWTSDFDKALGYLTGGEKGTAIQAGGAMGLWPHEMSKHFKQVYTFEPNEDNYRCLVENTRDLPNVTAFMAGLGATNGFCTTKLPASEQNNAGAFYTMPSEHGTPQVALDSMNIEGHVDMIQLDVEGRELQVLRGAAKLIEEFSPVIMLEEKRLPQDRETGHVVGAVEKYLTSIGYKVMDRVHRDIIFVRG